MNQFESLLNLFASADTRFLMRKSDYMSELITLIPYVQGKVAASSDKTYVEQIAPQFKAISENIEIKLTDDYRTEELDTLAYYRIRGTITAESWWRFSTKEFERELLQADSNPAIIGHFVHITSGGGEAWYLDQLAETIRSLSKPKFAFIEKVAASAGYYIASQFDRVTTNTPFDLIGCIGTMVSIMDVQPYFEKMGVKFIEEYATKSDLKNKKYNDLLDGNPKQFIEEELDPLQEQFVSDVKLTRSAIAAMNDDHPALRGETFYGSKALELGLVDDIETLDSAITNAYTAAADWKAKQLQQRKQALATLQL